MNKRPNLMVTCVVRRGIRRKKPPQPPKSRSVKYFNSLEHRAPKNISAHVGRSALYTRWTTAIRADMERKKLWPTGLQEWTIKHAFAYLKRLQSEFWKSTGLTISTFRYHDMWLKRCNLDIYANSILPLWRVFQSIYNKLRKQLKSLGIAYIKVYRFSTDPLLCFWMRPLCPPTQVCKAYEVRPTKFY